MNQGGGETAILTMLGMVGPVLLTLDLELINMSFVTVQFKKVVTHSLFNF